MNETSEPIAEEAAKTKKWWPPHFSLATALCLVLVAASILVSFAYWLYWNDSNRKYDLARPGHKDDNEILEIESGEADTTSPVSAATAEQKLKDFNKEVNALDSLGQFDPGDLSDQAIQLSPPEQPSL